MTEKLSFDEVLTLLMLEESDPSYTVLEKWQDRYPGYRRELADYFATWAIQEAHPVPSLVNVEKVRTAGVKYAMDKLRRQGRIVPQDQVVSLSSFEAMVLSAVYILHGDGDVAGITEKIREISGQDVMKTATAFALRGLQERFLVDSWMPDREIHPEAEDTVYYTITMTGDRALAHAKATSKVVADFLGDFA